MPREETIKVKVDKTEAQQSLQDLKKTADSIKKELGSIKVGDAAKAVAALAKASKDAAAADATRAKASKDAANADLIRAKQSKEIASTEAVRAKAAKDTANAELLKAKSAKEAAQSELLLAKASKELASAEATRTKATNQSETAMQKQINTITGVSNAAKNAAKSYESMAKLEIEYAQKSIVAQQKLELQQKRLDNKAILDQVKQRGKSWEEETKTIQRIQAEYKKLNDTLDAQKSKSQSSSRQEAFKGYLDRVKQEEEALKAEKRILAEYKKLNAEMDAEKSKRQNADAKETFKGYLERAAAMEKETKAAERLAQAHDRMGQSLGNIDKSQASSLRTVTELIRQQDGLSNSTVRATGIIRNSAGVFQTYAVSAKNADNTTKNFRVSVNTATGEVQMLDQGIKSASVSFKGLGTHAVSFIKRVVGFYGVAQTLRYALKEMKSMSDEMIVYQKVTKATDQQMEQIRKQSYATAKAYGQTPTDFLSAAQEMARAGYGEQSSAMADLAVKTKLVGDITAEEASKFLLAVDAGYKYGGSIEKLSHVLDMANEVGNNYATSIGKISEGMTLVASLAGQANIPIEQLIAALGTMTAATQRSGSEMARALRFVTLGILGDTVSEVEEGVTVTAEEVDSLSTALQHYAPEVVKAAKASGQLINPMEAIASLSKAYKSGLIGSQEELFSISKAIAGQRYYNAFAALVENYDTLYLGMLEHEKNAAGSADREIDVLVNSWTTKFNQLKTTWVELVNNTISENFIKSLIDAGKGALEFAGNLETLATMATGAYVAIKSLSAGIGNLSKNQRFGSFNGWALGIGLAITAIGAYKSSYEKSIRDLQAAAAKAAQEATEKATKETTTLSTLSAIQAKYEEIAKDGIQAEKGETKELKTLQDELNGLIGDQAIAIDVVNGKYEETIKKLKGIKTAQEEAARAELQTALAAAVANYKTHFTTYPTDFENIYNSVFGDNIGGSLTYSPGVDFNSLDDQSRLALRKYMSSNIDFGFGADLSKTGWQASIRADSNEYQIASDYKKYYDLYKWMATHDVSGAETSKTYNTIAAKNKDFYAKFGSFVSELKTYAEPVITLMESMKNLGQSTEEAGKKAEDGTKGMASGMEAATSSAITLASAIEKATKAKETFDDAMKTTKADALNDYTEAFETLQKEMDAGRVNSNAFYAAAEMLLGDEAYKATGGNSAAIRAAMNEKGESGSAYDAWKILTQKYYNKETGAELEGFGFAQLLSQTKGLDQSKYLDENGNISIKLTSEDIAGIAKAWKIDPAFLMAAWNAFDQYDQRGDRKTDDLMEEEAAGNAGEAEQAFADSTTAASGAVDAFTTSADKAAASADKAAASADKAAASLDGLADVADGGDTGGNETASTESDSDLSGGRYDKSAIQAQRAKEFLQERLAEAEGTAATESDSEWSGGHGNKSEIGPDVDQLLEQQSSLIEETKGLTDKHDTVIGDYNETIAGYDELINQANETSEKAAKTIEEVNTYLNESKTEDTAKKAEETQKTIDDLIERNPALADVAGKKQPESVPELEIDKGPIKSFTLDEMMAGYEQYKIPETDAKSAGEQAGEEFGEAFVFKSSEYTGKPLDTSMFDGLGEKAGEEFGEEYWQNMLLTAQRYKNGEDILPQYEEQLEKDLTENGGFIETVIEKYKASLAEAKDEAQKLNEELGNGEEKEVNVNVNDDQAEKDLNKITKPDTKTVTVSIVEDAGGDGRVQSILHQATGTRRHPGGYSLVNDGSGPELIVDNGQAFIAGGGKPTIVGLNKGAKVFTASETRAILNGASVPAYATGTVTGGTFKNVTTEKPDTSGKKDDKSKGKSSGPKVDKQAFSNLSSLLDYIIGRIGTALEEQLQVLDKQIEALQNAREATEEQNKLEELQQNVTDALNERTVRYLGEDGKWHWMADQKNVQQAQKSLREYEDELAFNAQVKEIEDQKTALQDEYNEITKIWSDIKNAVNTPTGSLEDLLKSVLKNGTPQQKAGAKSVQDTLISGIVKGVYTKNYDEALDAIAKATEGNPIMPGSGAASLASLIAMTGSGATGDSVTEALKTAASPISSITGSNGALAAGNNTNINYFIDGIKLGEGMENMPLSSIMKNLSVYTNTGVN